VADESALMQSMLMQLMTAIVAGDVTHATELIVAAPSLATTQLKQGATRQKSTDHFFTEIQHYVYGGDTALHVAAASYQPEIARQLMAHGASVSAKNRRGAQPLHYAADGGPAAANWNPGAQAATIAYLIKEGADPNAVDSSGVAPLHRAVRTRCAAAVSALVDGGADPRRPNRSGSTPLTLASQNTGRGGTGTPASKAQQHEIVRVLELHGAT
jgi:ankyrin repeat protein